MRSWIVLFVVCAWAGCSSGSKQAPAKPKPAPVEQQLSTGAPAVADAGAAQAVSPDAGANEWERFYRSDDVPLCLFENDVVHSKVPFLKDMKKQSVRANTELYFGVFAPGCASMDCIRLPTLQCWVEREGDTLVVHSRYHGEKRGGRVCKDSCEEITAGCPTPLLPPGRYTVRYGDRTMPLKIPSVLRSPCVRLDEDTLKTPNSPQTDASAAR